MPITGKFLADFDDFYAAVQKAEVSLRGMETGAGKVEDSLNKMVDSLSGRKIVQDATMMAEAVELIGGTAKLTEAELARVTRQATEAVAKMKALGQEVPAALSKLATSTGSVMTTVATASGTATTSLDKLAVGVSSVDRTMGALGVNISKPAAALNEMAVMAGSATSALGPFGLAVAAVGASFALWKNADAIQSFLRNLDTTIANTTAKMLGWGDVIKETATANLEALSTASVRAGREITNITEAMAINIKAAEDWAAAQDKAREASHRQANELERQFIDRVHKKNAEQDAEEKKRREKKEKDDKATAATLAAIDKQYRDYQNFLGERYLQDEAARMAEDVRLAQEAAAAKTKAYAEWFASVNQGLKIIGLQESGLLFKAPGLAITGGSQSLERPQSLSQRGVYLGENVPTYNPAAAPAGTVLNQTFNVNGTGEQVAREVMGVMTRSLKTGRRLPTA